MVYYVISSDTFKDRPYLRVAYDMIDGKLSMIGYSPMADWRDASLYTDEAEARLVLATNNPKKEKLRLLRINIDIAEV